MWMIKCYLCQKDLFTYDIEPKVGDSIKAIHATYVNGVKPSAHDPIKCIHCGSKLKANLIKVRDCIEIDSYTNAPLTNLVRVSPS